jgi:hypothetical protein
LAKFAKICIMLVRALALVSIVLGVLIWTGQSPNLLGAHIGIGFTITLLLVILAVLALAKRAFLIGLLGIAAAVVLPWIGFRQFPLSFQHLGAIQVAHILVVIAALGIAESLHAAVRKTA